MIAVFPLPPAITIGPASMSMPELAEVLTKAGMPVEAGVPLRSRGAFVCLKDRSPEEVKKLLAEGLGVVFEPRKDRLMMVPDPVAKERERRMLMAYTRIAGTEIRAWIEAQRKWIGSKSYEALVQSVKIAAEGAEQKEPTLEELRPILETMILLQPERWNIVRRSSLAATLPATVYGPKTEWAPFATTGLPDTVYVPDGPPVPPDAPIEYRMSFDPKEGVFSVKNWLFMDGYGRSGRQELSIRTRKASMSVVAGDDGSMIPIEQEGVEASFRKLGTEAEAFLATLVPRAELPDTDPLPGVQPKYVSVALERMGREAVMELSPRFEDVPRPLMWQSAPIITPKTLFTPVLPAYTPGFDPLAPLYPSEKTKAGMAYRAERRFPLRAVDRNGVWLVVNPYRFLDHAQFVSPVPFLRAERILKDVPADAPRDYGGNLMPTWNLAVRLYRAMRPETTLRESQKSFDYRGVSLHESSLLEPLIPIVEALNPLQRKAFWKTLANTGKAILNDSDGQITVLVRPFVQDPKGPKGNYSLDAQRLNGPKIINLSAFIDGHGSLVP
ncbi:hypothetical protein EON79_02065 [bacterium]|nr:MAG: hypothetical protein EON79_02065 [bacterium]